MLGNFSNEDWERFLKQSSDQLRMQPSNKVWQRISWNLHRRRRRVVMTSAVLLLSLFSLGYFLIDGNENKTTPAVIQPVAVPANAKEAGETPLSNTFKPGATNSVRQSSPANPKFIASENSTNEMAQKKISVAEVPVTKEPFTGRETLLDNSALITGNITGYNPGEYSYNTNPVPLQNNHKIKAPAPEVNATIPGNVTAKKRKLSFQLLFTPTISYRKLSENKLMPGAASLQNASAFTGNSSYNVNNAVTHKPGIGLELGFAAKYAVAKNVKLRSGLQFNISRYGIKAFRHPYEMATIALSSGYHVDSLSTVSHLRNFNGTEPNWVQNFYLQLSAPVGIEVKLRGNENMQLGIASTLQPTYLLGDRAYLLSTDYKNYAEVPWLIRRWNMAASIETFVAYSTGKINWQVGPQVRYQLFSSYSKKYPVKENLFDFGLKVGVSLNKAQ